MLILMMMIMLRVAIILRVVIMLRVAISLRVVIMLRVAIFTKEYLSGSRQGTQRFKSKSIHKKK